MWSGEIMRVVHFLHRICLEDGGVVRATLDLCGAMAARGHDVTLVTSDAVDVPEEWKAGGPGLPKVEEIPPLTGPLKLLSRWSRRALELLFARIDLVHIHEFWQPAAAQVAMIAKRVGTPYVVSAHGMLDDWSMAQSSLKKQVFLKVVGNRMFRGAGAVHCTAVGEARQARRHLPTRNTGVIPLVMDLEPYRVLPDRTASRAALPGEAAQPTIAFLGRLHPKKGVEHLIEAVASMATHGKTVELLIAGTGEPQYERQLQNLVAHHHLESRVHFLGHVAGDAKIRMLRAADVLVLPSHQENFGLVLVEALACGTPVITTKAVDIWPELESSGSAIIIEGPEVGAVSAAIGSLISNPDRRDAMGQLGRRWVIEHLNPDRVLDRFDNLYANLISGRAAPFASPAARRASRTATVGA